MRKTALELEVPGHTTRNVLKKDLKAKSRARTKKHLFTGAVKEKRLERSKRILSLLKKGPHPVFYSDEKLFTGDLVSNSRTDRYISPLKVSGVSVDVKKKSLVKHPAFVMVFGLISSDGKVMLPVFIKAGVKVNTNVHLDVLQKHAKPWIYSNYTPDDNVALQQDGALPYTSQKIQKWREDHMPYFWTKDM
ncbi:hypothetical protein SprV_0200779400 [Sparganum proliferum]